MRVLHLLDQCDPACTGTTLAMIADAFGRLGHIEQHVLLLGGEALSQSAQRVGLKEAQVIGVPRGSALLGWPTIARHLRHLPAFDLIHCWSPTTLTFAAMRWRQTPRVMTLTQCPSGKRVRWLRVMMREAAGKTTLLPISATIRGELLAGGIDESAVTILRPGIDMSRLTHASREALRQRWDIEDVNTRVVTLLSDPAPAADAADAWMAIGLTHEVLRSDHICVRLMTHPRQLNRLRAVNTARGLPHQPNLLCDDAMDHPWEVLPGCDLALAIGPHAGGLSLLWAMAANIPVVGEATYAVSEIIEDRHSALLTRPDDPRQIAHRLEQLIRDGQLAWKLRDTARHEAYSFFSRKRYCEQLAMAYEQMGQGKQVELPEMEVTGGLRFMGRA